MEKKHYWYITLFLSEVFASAILLFFGCLGSVDKSPFFTPSHLTVCLSFGLAIMVGINSFNTVSGGFMTPIITLTAYIYKKFNGVVALIYLLGQFVGSYVGYALVRAVIPDEYLSNPQEFCLAKPNSDNVKAFGIEFIVCFVTILFLCSVWHPKNAQHHDSASIKFGLLVILIALTAGPYSGTSLSPARAFAPALYNGKWEKQWLYWIAPMSGSLCATLLYKYVFGVDYSQLEKNNNQSRRGLEEEMSLEKGIKG